jgi:hypothetical protein
MSSNEQFEREFEDFLEQENSRVAALYRKLPRAEPDAKLDAAVQAMARRAQTAAPRVRARTPRWIPALSAAALVTLAAGIAFRIGPTVWQERQTEPLQKSAAENKVSPPTSAPTDAVGKTESDADAFKDKAAPKPAAILSPPAAPVPTNAAPAARAPSRTVQTAPTRIDAPTPQAFPPPALEQEKKSVETGATAAGANDAARAQAKGGLDEQVLDRKRDQPVQTAPAAPALKLRAERAATAPAAEPSATAAPAPAREEADAAQAELSSAPTPAQAASSGASAESTRAAPAAKAAHMAPLRSKDPNANLYPEHWLANIHTMLRRNRRDEALRSLAEFRKMYPDYHLPDDLRDLK